jgi:hypothetical protein
MSREAQRFSHYDRIRDRLITRNEMLSTRTDAFCPLDADGNNLLTFAKRAVITVDRFAKSAGKAGLTHAPPSRPSRQPKKPTCKC